MAIAYPPTQPSAFDVFAPSGGTPNASVAEQAWQFLTYTYSTIHQEAWNTLQGIINLT